MGQQTKIDPLGLVGTHLDRYYIKEIVGSGGMGAVYRAKHEFGDYDVAVKVLHSNLAADKEMVEYFFEEARKTATLKHPSIVRITDVGHENGRAFLVMEWLDGKTLEQELEEKKVLSLDRVAHLLEEITEAIEYAHNRNIIHRDLKPGNIMLVKDDAGRETIRILDFGVAKVLHATLGANTRITGTPFYASPEQGKKGADIDQRSDIYNLGVMLYELLSGERPFDADSSEEMRDLHNEAAPPSLRPKNPSLSQAIEEIVFKALAKRPADRYQTVTELARAFRQASSLATGVLIVECSDPVDGRRVSGAVVYLDGKHAGLTDEQGLWQRTALMPKSYIVEVVAPRYKRFHRDAAIEQANDELTVVVRLERDEKGDLVVVCGVDNAEIELDGVKAGRTGSGGRCLLNSIAAGTHTIRITHSRYEPLQAPVAIEGWKSTLREFQLTPRRSFLQAATGKISDWLKPIKGVVNVVWRRPETLKNGRTGSRPVLPVSGRTGREPVLPLSQTTRVCPRCAAPVRAGAKFCAKCSARLSGDSTSQSEPAIPPQVPCTSCGALLDASLHFCTQCGVSRHSPARIPKSDRHLSLIPARVGSLSDIPAPAAAPAARVTDSVGKKRDSAAKSGAARSQRSASPPILARLLAGAKPLWLYGAGALLALIVVGITLRIVWPSDPPKKPEVVTPSPTPASTLAPTVATPPEGMVLLEGGEFTMGRDDKRKPEEGPAHRVNVKPFFLDRTEVTNAQYQKFLVENPKHPAPPGWRNRTYPNGKENLPVTNVTWEDATTFTRWAGKRLPSEEEWEFAARGGKGWLYSWGDKWDSKNANAEPRRRKPAPVGAFAAGATPQGIVDLIGNVWEWTSSECARYQKSQGTPCFPGYTNLKIKRGGAFDSPPDVATSSHRSGHPANRNNWPGKVTPDYTRMGFRCAMDTPVQ